MNVFMRMKNTSCLLYSTALRRRSSGDDRGADHPARSEWRLEVDLVVYAGSEFTSGSMTIAQRQSLRMLLLARRISPQTQNDQARAITMVFI
jgi:hypothetical protein